MASAGVCTDADRDRNVGDFAMAPRKGQRTRLTGTLSQVALAFLWIPAFAGMTVKAGRHDKLVFPTLLAP